MPAIAVATGLAPRALLERAHAVERIFGRDRESEERWGPRTLDIDLIAYDDLTLNEPDLILPHPRLFERAFVLVPLGRNRAGPASSPGNASPMPRNAPIRRHRTAAGLKARPCDCVGADGKPWHFARLA